MAHKDVRQALAEAVAMKKSIRKDMAVYATQSNDNQQQMLKKQDFVAQEVSRLAQVVHDIKLRLERKKERKKKTQSLYAMRSSIRCITHLWKRLRRDTVNMLI